MRATILEATGVAPAVPPRGAHPGPAQVCPHPAWLSPHTRSQRPTPGFTAQLRPARRRPEARRRWLAHRDPGSPATLEPRAVPQRQLDGSSALGVAGYLALRQQADLGTLNGQQGSGCGQAPALPQGLPLKGTHAPFPPRGRARREEVLQAWARSRLRWGPSPNHGAAGRAVSCGGSVQELRLFTF